MMEVGCRRIWWSVNAAVEWRGGFVVGVWLVMENSLICWTGADGGGSDGVLEG